jgi:hypothetical protein
LLIMISLLILLNRSLSFSPLFQVSA